MNTVHRVYLAPYGVGLGHASRLTLLAQSLNQPGIQFVFSSFGEAYNYIRGLGFRCNLVPPVEFLWGKNGEFSVKNNIQKIPQWLVNLPLQINMEIKYLMEFNPRVIVSDSRLSPLIAANILDKPRILIINQIKLLLTPRLRDFKAARLYETCNGELMGGMWNIANRILIPDLPSPFTISEETISTVKSIRNKMNYIGFITPRNKVLDKNIETTKNQLGIDSKKHIIFVHISGPKATRLPIIKTLIEILKFQLNLQIIVSEGKTGGSTIPQRMNNSIWYYEWCPVRDEIMTLSDALIIRGGHTAISQAIQFGKPFISIPIESHGEQLSNSKKIEKLGIGISINPKAITSQNVIRNLNKIIYEDTFQKEMEKIRNISNKLNGIENIKDIILTYS